MRKLLVVLGVFALWLIPSVALAQEPVPSRVCVPVPVSTSSGSVPLDAYATVPGNGQINDWGLKISFVTDNSHSDWLVGHLAIYAPDGSTINSDIGFGGGSLTTINVSGLNATPGDYHLHFWAQGSNIHTISSLTVEACHVELSPAPVPPSSCELIVDEHDIQATHTTPITLTRSYSSTITEYVMNQLGQTNWTMAGIELNDGTTDLYSQIVNGSTVNVYRRFTQTVNISPGAYDFIVAQEGTNHPFFYQMKSYFCAPDIGVAPVVQCSTVPNADFQSADTWTLTGTATISNSTLSLTTIGDSATAAITNTTYSNFDSHTITITGTGTTSGTDDILLSLGGVTTTLTLTDTMTGYTATVASSVTTTPTLSIELLSGGADIDYVCFTDGGTQYCSTVQNSTFNTGAAWNVTGTNIVSGTAVMQPGGTLSQTLTGTFSQTVYSVQFTASTTSSGTIDVSLGGATDKITLYNGSAGYSALVTPVLSPTVLSLSNPSVPVTIDDVCVSLATSNQCLPLIRNPNFDTGDDWIFANGAGWNDVGQNAFLPSVDGTYDLKSVSYIGQLSLTGALPTVVTGQYLLLRFDAKSLQPGVIRLFVRNSDITNTVSVTYTAETGTNWMRYEMPLSNLNGEISNVPIEFFNVSKEYTKTGDIFLDNMCIFVSDTVPVVPYPTYPGGSNPGGGTPPGDGSTPGTSTGPLLLTCSDITAWLSSLTGVDFAALETTAAPSIWDPSTWVPYLAAKLWVNVGKPLSCTLFATSPGRILANYINWLADTWTAFVAWLTSTVAAFTAGISSWLAYLGGLWQPLAIRVQAGAIGLLNYVIAAWNVVLNNAVSAASGMVSTFIGIWNDSIAPLLSKSFNVWSLVGFFLKYIGNIGGLGMFFFNALWGMVQMVWHIISGIATLPIQFYFAFSDATNSTAFQLIPACTGDITNDWCRILFGVEVVNQAIGHSIAYPMVIVAIIVFTIMIFWRNIWGLISIKLR